MNYVLICMMDSGLLAGVSTNVKQERGGPVSVFSPNCQRR